MYLGRPWWRGQSTRGINRCISVHHHDRKTPSNYPGPWAETVPMSVASDLLLLQHFPQKKCSPSMWISFKFHRPHHTNTTHHQGTNLAPYYLIWSLDTSMEDVMHLIDSKRAMWIGRKYIIISHIGISCNFSCAVETLCKLNLVSEESKRSWMILWLYSLQTIADCWIYPLVENMGWSLRYPIPSSAAKCCVKHSATYV